MLLTWLPVYGSSSRTVGVGPQSPCALVQRLMHKASSGSQIERLIGQHRNDIRWVTLVSLVDGIFAVLLI